MLVLGVAVGVGLHFSQDSVKTDATYAVDKAESKIKSLEALINLKYLKKWIRKIWKTVYIRDF